MSHPSPRERRRRTRPLVLCPADPDHALRTRRPLVPLPSPAEPSAPPPPTRLNVLFLTVDALRADHLGCYGYERPTSPRIDAFAARDATLFRTAVSHSAWTVPGVVSMLTGWYPPVHGMDTRHKVMDAAMETPLEELAALGYRLYGYVSEGEAFGNVGFPPKEKEFVRPKLPDLIRRMKDDPFVIWYHLKHTHLPYQAAPEIRARFARETSPPLTKHQRNLVTTLSMVPAGSAVWGPESRAALDDLYDACVFEQDQEIGEVFDLLKSLGLWDRTIIVLTADHGEELAEHGEVGHASTTQKATLFGELLRIPFILRVPGVAEGVAIDDLIVQQVDAMPTVRSALGLAARPDAQGIDLMPYLTGRGDPRGREFAFSETTPCGWQCGSQREKTRRLKAVTTRRWRWIGTMSERGEWIGEGALYDLVNDPGERRNVAADHPEVVSELRAAMERHQGENLERAWSLVRGALDRRRGMVEALSAPERDEETTRICDELAMLRYVYQVENPSILARWGDEFRRRTARITALLDTDARRAYWGCGER